MKLYTNGCSFTYGDELDNPSTSCWPALIAKDLELELVNDAMSGGTNDRTVYRTIKNLQSNFDIYVIAWTSYYRFTVYDHFNSDINFNPSLLNSKYKDNAFFKNWGEIYYQHWFNELYAFKKWLQQIIQLQHVLSAHNYIMVNTMENNLLKWLSPKETFIQNTKKLICFDQMTDTQILDEYKEIQYYNTIIDKTKFVGWGTFTLAGIPASFARGESGHILEDGHRHVAEILKNHIDV